MKVLVYEKMPVTLASGEIKNRAQLMCKSMTPYELCGATLSNIPNFVWHEYEARWQSRAFKTAWACLSEQTLMLLVDYSENYSVDTNWEAMAAH